jgi:RHS repeat-associated protein
VTNVANKRGATVLSSYAYTYRLDGNQISKTDHNGVVTAYTYDDLGRLLTENNIAYTYDARGNRATMTVAGVNPYATVYVYDANNRLLSTTKTTESGEYTTTYTYDANGAQLSRIGSTPPELLTLTTQPETEIDTYNARGQLVSAYLAGQNVVYTYRPDGLRATKTVEGATTTHIWDGANIIADVGTSVTRYVHGVNLLFAETAFVKQYYLYNAHGDVVQLTDSAGDVEHEYHYDAFGVEVGAVAGDTNPFRYCGEYFDVETGTLYLRARNYDAGTGRFTSEDSFKGFLRRGLSLNLYTYCHNNPILYHDPSGHTPEHKPEIYAYWENDGGGGGTSTSKAQAQSPTELSEWELLNLTYEQKDALLDLKIQYAAATDKETKDRLHAQADVIRKSRLAIGQYSDYSGTVRNADGSKAVGLNPAAPTNLTTPTAPQVSVPLPNGTTPIGKPSNGNLGSGIAAVAADMTARVKDHILENIINGAGLDDTTLQIPNTGFNLYGWQIGLPGQLPGNPE